MKYLYILLIGLFAIVFQSCGDSEKFTISGELTEARAMNIYVKYYGNDAMRSGVTAVRDGKFEFNGISRYPTLVELMDNDRRILARVYISNGETAKLVLNPNNPYKTKISGSDINNEWYAVLNKEADSLRVASSEYVNELVERYVASNHESVVSTLLFTTMYDASVDPFRADSIFNMIDAEARPSALVDNYMTVVSRFLAPSIHEPIDSICFRTVDKREGIVFYPKDHKASVLAFTYDRNERQNSTMDTFKLLAAKKHLGLYDFVLSNDTASWKRTVMKDSADWIQGWAPGGLFAKGIDRLAIPEYPFFIVVDSLGVQTYRGNSLRRAVEIADKMIE